MSQDVHRRRYVSPIREEQARATRQRILDATLGLFLAQGYVATSIKEIAAEARVSEPTIYLHFKDKPSLLWALGERAVTIGEDSVELAKSEVIRSIRDQPDFQGRLRLLMQWSLQTHEQGIGEVENVLLQAAAAEPRVQQLVEKGVEQRKRDSQLLVGLLLEVAHPQPGMSVDEIADLMDAVNSTGVYQILVKERGWTSQQYLERMTKIAEWLFPQAAGPTE